MTSGATNSSEPTLSATSSSSARSRSLSSARAPGRSPSSSRGSTGPEQPLGLTFQLPLVIPVDGRPVVRVAASTVIDWAFPAERITPNAAGVTIPFVAAGGCLDLNGP